MSVNMTEKFILRPEQTQTYQEHALYLIGPLLIAVILVLFLMVTLSLDKAWRPWRWRISTFQLWKDFSFRLNRFRASRPAHFKPMSIDNRRICQVPENINADGVRDLIAGLRDIDIESLVEQARRTCDSKLMGGDHYKMPKRSDSDSDVAIPMNPSPIDGDALELQDLGAPEEGLGPVGMDANDAVVQACMAETCGIFRKLRDVDHVIQILGRMPNHRRAQRIVLKHPKILRGYFENAEHKSRGTLRHGLWIRALGVLELLPPQMPVKKEWVEDHDVDTIEGLRYVLDRLLGVDTDVTERCGRHGTQIRTLTTEALRILEQNGFVYGIRRTLRSLDPPREPRGDPRQWMRFLERKCIGNRRIIWCHPNASLPHEQKKKIEVVVEIPDVESAPTLDEIAQLETALKHRFADATTEWLTDSTTFMEIGLMIQRVLVVHHMHLAAKPKTKPESEGEIVKSEFLTPAQIWNELLQGKGSANVRSYGDLRTAAHMLGFLDPEGIREKCLAFHKLLESKVMERYFQVYEHVERVRDGPTIKTYYCKARYKSVAGSYTESSSLGGRYAGHQPTQVIDMLVDGWHENLLKSEDAHRAAQDTEVQVHDRYDPAKDPKCAAYQMPYARGFSLIVLCGTGTDEHYFYKVENRFHDTMVSEREGDGLRPYQVTPVHPTGDIGPFVNLSEIGGLPTTQEESAWTLRSFDFFDEHFRFNKTFTNSTASPLGYVLNTITKGGWKNQRSQKDARIRGIRVKAKVTVQEPAVKVSTAADVRRLQTFKGVHAASGPQESHDNLYTLVGIITINVETEMSMTWYDFLGWSQGRQRHIFGLQRRVMDLRFTSRKYGPNGRLWGVTLGDGIGSTHADEQDDFNFVTAAGSSVQQADPTPDGLYRLDAFQRDEFRKEIRTLCRSQIPETVGIPLNIALYPDIYTNPDVPKLCQTRAADSMNFWNAHVRPARGSVLVRIEWDGPLVERELADRSAELAHAEREALKYGEPKRDAVDAEHENLVESRPARVRRRIGHEPWYYPSEVIKTINGQIRWITRNIGFSEWEHIAQKEEAVEWAATLGFGLRFYRDCAQEVRLDATTVTSEDYVYRSRRAIIWGLRPSKEVDSSSMNLEFMIGCDLDTLPGRWFEHLAEVAVASRWVEVLAVVFLTSVVFWKDNIADAQMLEIGEAEYCADDSYELTQCWATNATYYYELHDVTRVFVNCSGSTIEQGFERMVCFFPPSGQPFDIALYLTGIGISYSVYKALSLGLAFGLYNIFPSGRRGIETTVALIVVVTFASGVLVVLFSMASGLSRFTGQYDFSVMSTVLVASVGLIIMVHALKYYYKHAMVLWEIENFGFGAASDENYSIRRMRIPYTVTKYSMPDLCSDDEFVSANKPWKSQWYTDRTSHPSTLSTATLAPVSNYATRGFGFDAGSAAGARAASYLEVDGGSKYNC